MSCNTSEGDDSKSDPPVPIEASGQIARTSCDERSIPEGLFPEEHVDEKGEFTVVRAGITCPKCGSNVFYHPESIIPCNTVQCFNCSWSSLKYAWWEDPKLTDF